LLCLPAFITGSLENPSEGAQEKGGDEMEPEERATGTRNEEYNLVSVLYHALHGAETCEMYALDAEAAGDDDLASFFRNVQATHRQVAEQAKTRLYTGNIAMPDTAEVGTSRGSEVPTGSEVPPIPRDVRRGTSAESPRPAPPEDEREPPPPGPPPDTNPPA
jgi:hypothetical protein